MILRPPYFRSYKHKRSRGLETVVYYVSFIGYLQTTYLTVYVMYLFISIILKIVLTF